MVRIRNSLTLDTLSQSPKRSGRKRTLRHPRVSGGGGLRRNSGFAAGGELLE